MILFFNDMCNEELLKLFESRRQVSRVFGCGLQILVHCIVKFVLCCFRAIKLGLIGFIENRCWWVTWIAAWHFSKFTKFWATRAATWWTGARDSNLSTIAGSAANTGSHLNQCYHSLIIKTINSPCEDLEASANYLGPACIFRVEILTSHQLLKLYHLLKAPFSVK